jgi:hypothetical protein
VTCELILDDGDRVVGYLIEDITGALRICLPLADATHHTVELGDPSPRLRESIPPRSVPCIWCSTPSSHGRFCTDECRTDAYAQRLADRRERVTATEGNPR